jgi:hypothetical protein
MGNGLLEHQLGCCNCVDCQRYVKGLEERIVKLEKLVDSLTSSVDSLTWLATYDEVTQARGEAQ